MSRRKKKSNFGKVVKLILAMILVFIVVVMASMGIARKITKKEPENEVKPEVVQNVVKDEKVAKVEDGKDYIYEKDSFEISETYNPEMPNDRYTTTLQLPYINLDSEDAKRLNATFQDEFEKAKRSVKKGDDGYGLELLEFNYKSSIIDDKLISLAVNSGELYVPGDATLPTTIYNIDLETGNLIGNEVVIEKLGLTIEDLEKLIEKAMKKVYEEAKRESEEEFVYSEILEYYGTEEELIKAAKTNYANTKLYVLDNKTIAMELNYKNIDSLKTWTQIELD